MVNGLTELFSARERVLWITSAIDFSAVTGSTVIKVFLVGCLANSSAKRPV
jgi:hypothetical protein